MISDLKAQVAEWELLDKEWQTSGYYALPAAVFDALNNLPYCKVVNKAPAMLQAVKQLMARVEELEANKWQCFSTAPFDTKILATDENGSNL